MPGFHQGGRYEFDSCEGTFVKVNGERQVHMAASLRRQGSEPYTRGERLKSQRPSYTFEGKKFTILTIDTPDEGQYCVEVGDLGKQVWFPNKITYCNRTFEKYFESQVDLNARYRCVDCQTIHCNKEMENWKWDFCNEVKKLNEVPHKYSGQWYETGHHDQALEETPMTVQRGREESDDIAVSN